MLLVAVADVPGPPPAPEVYNVLCTSCTVKYQLPSDEGDAPVTGYHVQRRLVSTGDENCGWETVNKEPISALELIVEQLKPLSEYEFRIAAENKHGVGDFGAASLSVKCFPDLEAQSNLSALQRYATIQMFDVHL